MPEWIDSLSDHGRQAWYSLLQSMVMAYRKKDKKQMVEISAKLESVEEIGSLIRQQPGRANASHDTD